MKLNIEYGAYLQEIRERLKIKGLWQTKEEREIIFNQIHPEYLVFKRFASISDGSWNVGKGSWSAIVFIPKRDVVIYGVGITEPNDRE